MSAAHTSKIQVQHTHSCCQCELEGTSTRTSGTSAASPAADARMGDSDRQPAKRLPASDGERRAGLGAACAAGAVAA